ncbi:MULTISPECIES: IdeS/Mac family cysteine endopeptidase [unclassified Treponema]|uniref:IdeS/Mac family cysteine endopeptidase n=1 Tax=unclassified Treponema TaxID=2638727 RepID=UPI0020A3AC8E|nr:MULTISPECIES: IdeS/Mac family cysteine endopeptidase [unclassified Treponema]UTC66722.1 Ig-like domain-containing protein [Treponema sp. OMZ 789]UTC69454.1 Ig-like domain-containing protein [Treponema sp. OMZ 790]UTC72168.1 Ig-like domain-containing protein [Treponema sp. OMZ 791]
MNKKRILYAGLFGALTALIVLLAGCPNSLAKTNPSGGGTVKPHSGQGQNPDNSGQPAPFIPKYVPVTEVVLHDVNDELIEEDTTLPVKLGEQFQLKPVIKPENATNKEVEYKYEENLVSVTEDGLVTGKKKGPATVNVWVDGKKRTSIGFQIKDDSSVTFDKTEIKTDYQTESASAVITKKTTHSKYFYSLRYADGKGDWVEHTSVSAGNIDTITVKLKENKSLFERRAYLVFKTDNTDKAKLIREIPIIQKAHPKPVLTTKWIHGITEPLDGDLKPEAAASPLYRKWEETASTKWFNARKLCYTEKFKAVQDNQMCWAMSTADLIHWWMRENKDNLARYVQKKGIIAGTEEYKIYAGEYKGGSGDAGEGEKSSVANVFRKSFPNTGADLNTAVNWYLRGNTSPLQKEAPPGIVKDVFGGQDDLTKLIISRAVKTKAEFEQMIKEALKEGHAIAVIIKPVKNVLDPLHVVTVWGVVFDEDNNIVELWNSDSNDAYSHIVKFGVHYPGGVPHKINYGAKNDKGDTRIEEVIIMKSAKKEFEEWLDAHP